jgi:hypothetical protein
VKVRVSWGVQRPDLAGMPLSIGEGSAAASPLRGRKKGRKAKLGFIAHNK